MAVTKFRSIFAPGSDAERQTNFESYFDFTRHHAGALIEPDKDLANKRARLEYFRTHPVRSRRPLADAAAFYRNYVDLIDDPASLDRKILLLTCIYKFARHEWVGISGAWDATNSFAAARTIRQRITCYHLAEEFCHVRFFHEMFRTMQLDKVEWRPLGLFMGTVYRIFPYFPEALLAAPAFVTELMGIVFYRHLDRKLDEVLADEPEAKERIRELLREITVDELAHVGLRRNFLGPIGTRVAKRIVGPLFRSFYRDIPEAKYLFDVDTMVRDGIAFDYGGIPADIIAESWIPSYCWT